MKMKSLMRLVIISSFVLFAYVATSAQEKETANDTKQAAEKTKVVVTDGLAKAADATKTGVEKSAKAVKTFGSNAVEVTDNVVGKSAEVGGKTLQAGRYYTVKTWDGTKWVSKQVWYETKAAGTAVTKTVKN